MAKPQKPDQQSEINVLRVTRGRVTICILGTTPLLMHRFADKAWQELLMPSAKKTAADKAANLKHNPIEEFRSAALVIRDEKAPTYLGVDARCFKNAMSNAAIDLPGTATKAAIGRLCWVVGEHVPVFGLPRLHMAMVRMSDMARTPDVRTRPILPQWAAKVTVEFTTPMVTQDAVVNLMAGAGITNGIGDWRTQKGKGNYGSFEVVEPKDARFLELLKITRKQQEAAMRDPEPYDSDTADLLSWWTAEVKRREFKVKEVG